MEYREKVKVANAALEKLESGSSIEEIKMNLNSEGYSSSDIRLIEKSVYKQLKVKSEEVIQEMIETGIEEEIPSRFKHLPEETLLEVVTSAKKKIFTVWRRKIKKAIDRNATADEIKVILAAAPFNDAEKMALLRKVAEMKESDSSKSSAGIVSLLLGLALIIAGVVLSLNTAAIFYGAVIVGAGLVIKGVVSMAT